MGLWGAGLATLDFAHCEALTDGGLRVAARGCTQPGGRPHAEAMALAQAGEAARGGTERASRLVPSLLLEGADIRRDKPPRAQIARARRGTAGQSERRRGERSRGGRGDTRSDAWRPLRDLAKVRLVVQG